LKKSIRLFSNEEAMALYGSLDERLRFAESEFRVRTSARNFQLIVEGDKQNVHKAVAFFAQALNDIRKSPKRKGSESQAGEYGSGDQDSGVHFFHKGKLIKPKSDGQQKFIEAIGQHDVVFSIGPAGTGKTYLAMAMAIDALKRKVVQKIILTRPAVEAGENLGFLPGDLAAKINPYLRPLYDALYDMMDSDEVLRNMQRGIIEVAPLAYMRGRTLNDAFIILDEAQNCTYEQLKMFLTRLGFSSKMIVNGDVTQIDLPGKKQSGLIASQKILQGVNGIKFVYLTEIDVVRHKLVKAIIKAYEAHEGKA
jgi:phosphate starvation-inducible protein PhoH and related proteins